jgi:hypothetical protein
MVGVFGGVYAHEKEQKHFRYLLLRLFDAWRNPLLYAVGYYANGPDVRAVLSILD